MKKSKIPAIIGIAILLIIVSQESLKAQTSEEYVYIAVTGKLFSKKLNVFVDFGDTPDQIVKSGKYSEKLTGRRSYIGVLNYMFEDGYELVETIEFTSIYQGSGGTSGLGFILRKQKE